MNFEEQVLIHRIIKYIDSNRNNIEKNTKITSV